MDVNLHNGKKYYLAKHPTSGDKCTIYTVAVHEIKNSLFNRLLDENNATNYHSGLLDVITRLTSIGSKTGALREFFKFGQWKDERVCYLYAEPPDLRVYCIWLSEKLIIIGGGAGKSVAKWQDDIKLTEEVSWMIQVITDLSNKSDIAISKDGYRFEGNLKFNYETT